MSRFIGLDLHKEYIHGCEWSPVDPRERHFRFPNTQEAWEQFLAELDGSCQVALEVTGGAFEIYDRLAEVAGQVVVANPLEMKRLGSGRHTDRNDAARLAKMLALGVLPGVWVPPASIRELRNLLRFRERLVCTRRRFINQAKAVLRRHGHTLADAIRAGSLPRRSRACLPATVLSSRAPIANWFIWIKRLRGLKPSWLGEPRTNRWSSCFSPSPASV